MLRFVILLLVLGWASTATTAADAQKRIALLIGNQNYSTKVGPLQNPHSDVAIVGAALKSLGFQVAIKTDLDYRSLDAEIKRHIAAVRRGGPGTISFFYYSGHGAADPDTKINFLIPVDVENADDAELWTYSLNLNGIVEGLREQAPAATHYVVFDACRSELNLTRKGEKALAGKGFVPMSYTPGVLVAYATAPGRTASDVGNGAGPYARALAEELLRPGVEAMTMFRNVALRVHREIDQDPWMSSSTLPEMYFADDATPNKPASTPPVKQAPSSELERAWDVIKESTDVRDFEAFRRQYGKANAFYDLQAERRIAELKKAAAEARARAEDEARRRKEENAAAEKRAAEEAKRQAEAAAARKKAEIEAEAAKAQADAATKHKAEINAKTQAMLTEAEGVWATVKDTTEQSVLEAYIKQYGTTFYGSLARARIAGLKKAAAEQAEAEAKRQREESVAAQKRAAEEAKQLAEATAANKKAEKEAAAVQDCNQKEDNERRIRGCAELIHQYPQNAVAYNNRGIAYSHKKEYTLALSDYTKALEIDPNRAGTHHNRGLAYLATNQRDRASAEFKAALKVDPSMQASKDLLERIERSQLNGGVTFAFTNATDAKIHLKFFAQQSEWVWPNAKEVFVLNEHADHSVRLDCKIGGQICFGANSPGRSDDRWWGVGLDGKKACTKCCLMCGRRQDNTRSAWTLTDGASHAK